MQFPWPFPYVPQRSPGHPPPTMPIPQSLPPQPTHYPPAPVMQQPTNIDFASHFHSTAASSNHSTTPPPSQSSSHSSTITHAPDCLQLSYSTATTGNPSSLTPTPLQSPQFLTSGNSQSLTTTFSWDPQHGVWQQQPFSAFPPVTTTQDPSAPAANLTTSPPAPGPTSTFLSALRPPPPTLYHSHLPHLSAQPHPMQPIPTNTRHHQPSNHFTTHAATTVITAAGNTTAATTEVAQTATQTVTLATTLTPTQPPTVIPLPPAHILPHHAAAPATNTYHFATQHRFCKPPLYLRIPISCT